MPLRRYLRISKYTTLELRIHVAGSDTSWFSPSMLREIVQLIKPLVIPKLLEERNSVKKNKKKNPVKDDIIGDGFTASFFLEDVQTKHTIMSIDKSLEFTSKETHDEPQFAGSSPLFVASQAEDDERDDKPSLRTDYTGFRIFDKALWLLVRPSEPAKEDALGAWLAMTQQQQGETRADATL